MVDENGELHRLLAYVYGTAFIFAGFVVWAASVDIEDLTRWGAVSFLARAIFAAGIGTLCPRIVRWVQEYRALKADRADYEQANEGGLWSLNMGDQTNVGS